MDEKWMKNGRKNHYLYSDLQIFAIWMKNGRKMVEKRVNNGRKKDEKWMKME